MTDLFHMLTGWARSRDDLAVFADLKMCWGIPGLKNPGPDIAVVPGVRDRKRKRDSFDVMKEGTRPCLVIEVVSIDDTHTELLRLFLPFLLPVIEVVSIDDTHTGERLLHGEQEETAREEAKAKAA